MGILVSASEAALLCGCSDATIRRYISNGRLPAEPQRDGPRRTRPAHDEPDEVTGTLRRLPSVGASRWCIDVDHLVKAGLHVDETQLNWLAARRATPERVRELEAENMTLRATIARLETRIKTLTSYPSLPDSLEGEDGDVTVTRVRPLRTAPARPDVPRMMASPSDTFPSDWVTIQDVHKRYGIADRTLRDAILNGYIPAHKGEWKRGAHKPKIGIDPQQLAYILTRFASNAGPSDDEMIEVDRERELVGIAEE